MVGKLLSTKEISDMLKVSEETVRRWIRTGELKAVQEGKSYLVAPEELNKFTQKKSETPGTSLSKMTNLLGLGINKLIDQNAGSAGFLLSIGLDKRLKQNDIFEKLSIEDLEFYIETLKRQKRKVDLEYQMKLLEVEDEISKVEKLIEKQKES
jgi:excisionase family DNA binding protein